MYVFTFREMERKTITTFLLLVQLTCGVFSWGRPVWCPAGRFFNITSFKCQDCKTCSGVLKFISRPCSGIHDTRCSSFFFGANWMFKTINNSCTKQTIDPSLKVELSIETKQQVPIVSEKRASIDEEPNDEVEIEIWLPAACVVAAVFLLAAISCFAFERYSEKQKRRKRHGTLPHLEGRLKT